MQVSAGLVSSEASLAGRWRLPLLSMAFLCTCLGAHLLLCKNTSQVRAGPSPPYSHTLRSWGSGRQHMNLEGDTVQPIAPSLGGLRAVGNV